MTNNELKAYLIENGLFNEEAWAAYMAAYEKARWAAK